MGVRFSPMVNCSMSRGSLKSEQGKRLNEKGRRCVRLDAPAFCYSALPGFVNARNPPRSCHCEDRSDVAIFAQVTRRLLRFARNDRLLANVILRHVVPKNLVHCMKNPPVQRTKCIATLSMTGSRLMSFLRRCAAHSKWQPVGSTSQSCHCQDPVRATWQSPRGLFHLHRSG
jgi:hypothetical protein